MPDDPSNMGELPLVDPAPALAAAPPSPLSSDLPSSPDTPSDEERDAMLDVHPALHAASTWREFFIHIATICLGLLIAIGLEQTVEAIHRQHQLNQLQEDLHGEVLANQPVGEYNLASVDRDMSWLLELRSRIDAVRSGADRRSFVYPTRPHGYPGDPHDRDRIIPLDAVWNTARETALVDLLSRDKAQIYSSFYRITDIYDDDFKALTEDWRKLTAFEFQFSDANLPPRPDIQRMSAAQLDQYAAVVDEVFINAQDLKRHLQIQMAWNESVIDLRPRPNIADYLKAHPDPLPPFAPSTDH